MKQIEVVAAVILAGKTVFCAQRNGKGEVAFKWEFPGGKVEAGETHKDALMREIEEELGASIDVESFFMTVRHQYVTFHLTMHCYKATLKSASIRLNEHLDSRWLNANELFEMDWAPADLPVVEKVRELLLENA